MISGGEWRQRKSSTQSILGACRDPTLNYEAESLDPMISSDSADKVTARLQSLLDQDTPTLSVKDAFKIALEIESSEIDVIYGKLLELGGPHIGKTMESLGIPRQCKDKSSRPGCVFCSELELLQAAESSDSPLTTAPLDIFIVRFYLVDCVLTACVSRALGGKECNKRYVPMSATSNLNAQWTFN